MALDGLFLYKLSEQLNDSLLHSKVEKIYQPSKEELVFVMRTKQGAEKLYFNSRADSARVHLSEQKFINPPQPPMLCMLLRKKFTSAWLERIEQSEFERILVFHFSALNDFGERVPLKIVCEIMGRYSNVIFVDENETIIDSIKRVGASKSSVREILPGIRYVFPPAQNKYNILKTDLKTLCAMILSEDNVLLSKSVLKYIKGISPLRSREIAYEAYANDVPVYEAAQNGAALLHALEHLRESLLQPTAGCIVKTDGRQIGFSYTDILQFGEVKKKSFTSLSALLDVYYENRIAMIKRTQSGGELLRIVSSAMEKLRRKTALQQKELLSCENSDTCKLYGELINANLYALEDNETVYHLLNYYTGEMVDIPAHIQLTPVENANRYYKEYRKKENAKVYLNEQINLASQQLEYLESVLDLLERAGTPEEIAGIKRELVSQGYLKAKQSKKEKTPKELKPLCFQTSSGFQVLVGRNNLCNDKLTFKLSAAHDIWFHTKNIHGSHTVLRTGGDTVPQSDILEAAEICAYYSKARESSGVPVDYTCIKHVRRQAGNIPGRVLYTDYQTVYVTPQQATIEALKR